MKPVHLKPIYCRGQFLHAGRPVTRASAQHAAMKLARAAGKGARAVVNDCGAFYRVGVTR